MAIFAFHSQNRAPIILIKLRSLSFDVSNYERRIRKRHGVIILITRGADRRRRESPVGAKRSISIYQRLFSRKLTIELHNRLITSAQIAMPALRSLSLKVEEFRGRIRPNILIATC